MRYFSEVSSQKGGRALQPRFQRVSFFFFLHASLQLPATYQPNTEQYIIIPHHLPADAAWIQPQTRDGTFDRSLSTFFHCPD
jgi:hypothetical protein